MNYETAKRHLDELQIHESRPVTVDGRRFTYLGLYVDERKDAQAVLRPWDTGILEMLHPSWLITDVSVAKKE